ncbi:MAG: Asp-tRNA(Asn)/Glu-tRNA(Gln) amidotransferase subunit GatA [Roseburia sp.]|nr:Asp-tRNA(Asn)/Glu-tRNA(Gln) amidotransferase subunit GatA [Roseburia sp.]MCM1098944.1 Asp-tRNA(Asn)/Glu-tRNA(Gln) amidotransferase subunit GatA [Ruminococcus flavefaciens]
MTRTEILGMSALELGNAIREGETTAVEATEAVLARIQEKEPEYHCYITIEKEKALASAARIQERIEKGELTGPLAGVPGAVKDNLCTEGIPTTCASRILKGFIPAYTAEAVRNLEKAGMVLIGKTNMDEFAMGSTTETSAFGPTKNPRNPEHVPGGSSGGSAAAVAAGECFFALGSDTGGSIRLPASHCGVVGMKPTYGTVSRYGLIAYGSSLDQVGPLAKTVEDCAAVLEAIAARDEKDSTSVSRENRDFRSALVRDIRGMRIGIPEDYLGQGLEPEVRDAVLQAAKLLQAAGAAVEEFDLGLTEYGIPAYYTIASAEASSNLERFDGVKYGYRAGETELHELYRKTRSRGFGSEVKRRIMLGSFVLSEGYYDAYYLKALRVRSMIRQAFDRAFEVYDCVLGPVAPRTAPRLGESLADPMKMYLGDIYTVAANLAGLPGISLPCGTDRAGLPVGLQLIGDCFQEKKLLRAAYTFEQLRKEAGNDTGI